jgi:hypothetical protein
LKGVDARKISILASLFPIAVLFACDPCPSCSPKAVHSPTVSTPFVLTKGSMSTERFAHTASLLGDGSGRVLIAGGGEQPGVLNLAEIYLPSQGTFVVTAGAMVEPRKDHTATRLKDGRVLLAGGDNGLSALVSAEIFDPKTRSFSATGSMFAPRTFHTATLLPNGVVVVIGGSPAAIPPVGNQFSGPVGALSSAEFFAPKPGEFVGNPGALNSPRTEHTATLLQDGKSILVVGGVDDRGAVLDSAEILNATTGGFRSAAGSMSTVRRNHAATLLKDGKVLITGGLDNTGTLLNSAEIYDPQRQKFFRTKGTMQSARAFHIAMLLADGHRVVIAGGSDTTSAEIYDTTSGEFTATTGEHSVHP